MIREVISDDCLLPITADTDSDAGTGQNSETRQRIRQCQSRTRPGLPFIISLNDDGVIAGNESLSERALLAANARRESGEGQSRAAKGTRDTRPKQRQPHSCTGGCWC